MVNPMRVLIGYDGSSDADAAIDDLSRADLPSKVEALVVTVGDAPIVPSFVSHEEVEKAVVADTVVSIIDHANKHVSEALREANKQVLKASSRLKYYFPSWHVRGEVFAGSPAPTLVRRAEEWKDDLIVVGSQGRSAIGRFILGSVSMEVATNARCSVRIGRRRFGQTDRQHLRIVIGLDGSPGAEKAVRKVLGRAWPAGTELQIVVVDDGVSTIKTDVLSASAEFIREDTSIGASRMISLAGAKGLAVLATIKKGDAEDALLAEAREWEADSIVVGSTGSSNAPHGLFAKSVSTGLAANAKCSIEIVR